MRGSGFGFVLVGCLATLASGQEAITIKSANPQPGQRIKVSLEEKTVGKTVFTVMGKTQAKDEVKGKSLVYVDDVLENPKNANQPTKLKRTYEKAVIVTDGNTTKLPVEGKTVLIEKKGEQYAFTVDGEAVTGEALRVLETEFNRTDKLDARHAMLPKMPVKAGESWKIDVAELAKTMPRNGPQIDRTQTTATGKLVKTYQKNGTQFGVIEFVFDAPITGLGEKTPITIKEGRMTIKATGDGCTDGSSPTGKMTSKMTVKLVGSGMGIDLNVDFSGDETRTEELLKR